jgi:hypothetical protein
LQASPAGAGFKLNTTASGERWTHATPPGMITHLCMGEAGQCRV